MIPAVFSLPKDGEVQYFPSLFSFDESNDFLNRLQTEIAWRHEPIRIFGKSVMQPRLTALYGDSEKEYRYSGLLMKPMAWTQALLEIKKGIEALSNVTFTTALLNQYRNEKDSMGWHRDNEKELGLNPVIGSVSLGAPRNFQMRHYYEKNLKESIDLEHGSFLLMRGPTQHFWEHCLPKRSKSCQPRINITFRVIKNL